MEDNYSFCPECGNKVEGKHKFCNKCGAELKQPNVQTNIPKADLENSTKRNIVTGVVITIVVAIGFGLISYKSIFSNHYLSQANKVPNFEEKVFLLKNSMNYK